MLLIVGAAAGGLFGSGLMSKATAGGADLLVEYDRFARYLSPVRLTIRTRADAAGAVIIRIDSKFIQDVKIDKIVPEPAGVETENGWLAFRFNAATPGEVAVQFDLIPDRTGPIRGTVASGNAAPVSIVQFVYP